MKYTFKPGIFLGFFANEYGRATAAFTRPADVQSIEPVGTIPGTLFSAPDPSNQLARLDYDQTEISIAITAWKQLPKNGLGVQLPSFDELLAEHPDVETAHIKFTHQAKQPDMPKPRNKKKQTDPVTTSASLGYLFIDSPWASGGYDPW